MTTNRPYRTTLCLGVLLSLGVPPLLAEGAEKQVYECKNGDQVILSEEPCGANEQRLEVGYNPADNAEAAQAEGATKAEEAQASDVAEAELLDTEILNAQERITALEDERDARLAEIAKTTFSESEQLDEQAWKAQKEAAIQAVNTQYDGEIQTEQARLADLQTKRAALPPSSQP